MQKADGTDSVNGAVQPPGISPEFQDFLRSITRTVINDHIEKAALSIVGAVAERCPFISASVSEKNNKSDLADSARLSLACGISRASIFIGIRDKSFSAFFEEFRNTLEKQLSLACSIKSMLIKDPLSGLFNSAYFDECSASLFRDKKLSALAFIDIDKFKNVNEKYGHKLGNSLINSFASFLKQQLSENMAAFRYGGDEFAIIFSDPEKDDVIRFLNELVRVTSLTEFPCGEFSEKINISISAGAAFADNAFRNETAMLSAAEKAMFNAKKSGGSKLELA